MTLDPLRLIEEEHPTCPACHSTQVIKHGKSYGLHQIVQRYTCKACGTNFRPGDHYLQHQFPREVIDYAVAKVKEGHSSRAIKRILQHQFHLAPSYTTITQWAAKFGHITYPRQRPLEARRELVNALLHHITAKTLTQETGLPYSTVKTFLRRLRTQGFTAAKRPTPSQQLLLGRIRQLEKTLQHVQAQLQALRKAVP